MSRPGHPFKSCKRCKPSSVPLTGPLSFIYDRSHLRPPATYPSASGEQPLIADIHGLATRKAYSRTTLLPPRWALTPPFHPYRPTAQAAAGGYFLLRYYTLTDVEPLTRAALCVARTFLPPPKRTAIERACIFRYSSSRFRTSVSGLRALYPLYAVAWSRYRGSGSPRSGNIRR